MNKRRLRAQTRMIWGCFSGRPNLEFAPKWTRHSESHANPHLRPDEREPMAPKYGFDAIPRRYISPKDSCGCECCTIWDWSREEHERRRAQRQMTLALKRAANHTSAVWRDRCIDWDWNGWDDPFAYDGDDDWRLDYQADKSAPLVEIDLWAMAKPAKVRHHRRKSSFALCPPVCLLCAGITLPIHPEAEQANGSSEIDDISLLDYEEMWDDLDTDYGSVGHGADQMSDTSGDWDRCSNTGNVPESEVFPVETR